jgi:hypothetical protein
MGRHKTLTLITYGGEPPRMTTLTTTQINHLEAGENLSKYKNQVTKWIII